MISLGKHDKVIELSDLLDDILHSEPFPLEKEITLAAYIQRPRPTDAEITIFSKCTEEWQRPQPITPAATFRLTESPEIKFLSSRGLFAFTQIEPPSGSCGYTNICYGEGSMSKQTISGELRQTYSSTKENYMFEINKFLGDRL